MKNKKFHLSCNINESSNCHWVAKWSLGSSINFQSQ